MPKKIVKKRKIKIFRLLGILLILSGIVFACYCLLQVPVKNIVIKNTMYLNDDTVLELAELKYYPNFFFTRSRDVVRRLGKSDYIYKASLNKKWGFLFEIILVENKPLFWDTNQNKYVLEHAKVVDDDEVSHSFLVPRLLNYVPDVKYQRFINEMSNVNRDILAKISDIEYQPNDYDKDRFLLYMDDGNMVYLTLTKFKMINHYNEVYKQLENHKGILYLDNGNHFQIKE